MGEIQEEKKVEKEENIRQNNFSETHAKQINKIFIDPFNVPSNF